MSIAVDDWAGEIFVRLWYRPTGMAWDFVDTSFIIASCPAPVREQYDMIKERVDNGTLVLKQIDEFAGEYCTATYGVQNDSEYDYTFDIVVRAVFFGSVKVVPSKVSVQYSQQNSQLWMTTSEALASVNYIGC